jgi:hypothetical protein
VIGPTVLAAVVCGLLALTSNLPPVLGDAFGYSLTTLRLVTQGVFSYGSAPLGVPVEPSAFITPGYVVFLSAFYAFGRSAATSPAEVIAVLHPAVVVAQLCMSLGIVSLLSLTGRMLGRGRLAWVTGVLAALYLPFYWAAEVALSEQLGALLAVASLAFAVHLCGKKTPRHSALMVGFGALSGCLAMVRPVMAAWFIALMRLEGPRRFGRLIIMVALGFMLVLTPWIIRNAVVLHRFVPLSANAGGVLFDGTGGCELTLAEQKVYDLERALGADEGSTLGRIGRQRIQADLRSRPQEFITGRLTRAGMVLTGLWSPVHDVLWELKTRPEANSNSVSVSRFDAEREPGLMLPYDWMKLYRWLILGGFISGFFFVRRVPLVAIAISMPLYTIAMHSFTLFNNRYFYPSVPAMIVVAGVGWMGAVLTVVKWYRNREGDQPL